MAIYTADGQEFKDPFEYAVNYKPSQPTKGDYDINSDMIEASTGDAAIPMVKSPANLRVRPQSEDKPVDEINLELNPGQNLTGRQFAMMKKGPGEPGADIIQFPMGPTGLGRGRGGSTPKEPAVESKPSYEDALAKQVFERISKNPPDKMVDAYRPYAAKGEMPAELERRVLQDPAHRAAYQRALDLEIMKSSPLQKPKAEVTQFPQAKLPQSPTPKDVSTGEVIRSPEMSRRQMENFRKFEGNFKTFMKQLDSEDKIRMVNYSEQGYFNPETKLNIWSKIGFGLAGAAVATGTAAAVAEQYQNIKDYEDYKGGPIESFQEFNENFLTGNWRFKRLQKAREFDKEREK